jgi:hypothetical protein
MSDLVVLYEGYIIPIGDISNSDIYDPEDLDLLFFPNGRVRRFKKGSTAYMAIFDDDSNLFKGYFPEMNFWDYNTGVDSSGTKTTASNVGIGSMFLVPITRDIPDNSNVILGQKKIQVINKGIDPGTDTEVVIRTRHKKIPISVAFSAPFTNQNNTALSTLTLENTGAYSFESFTPIPLLDDIENYLKFIYRKQLLLPNGTLSDDYDNNYDVFEDIAYVLNEIYSDNNLTNYLLSKGLKKVFDTHLDLQNRYNSYFGEVEPAYHNLYNEEYFSRFRLQLIKFRYWLLRYKTDYNAIDVNDLVVYIVNLFPVIELSFLEYWVKIKLLRRILENNWWIIGGWGINELNEEQAIVKIVRCIKNYDLDGSINYSDIDDFMDFLAKEYQSGKSLYEVLYESVQDQIFFGDDGNGSKGNLVKAIYDLWIHSKFNPNHSNPFTADAALNHFTYKNVSAVEFHDYVIPTMSTVVDYSAAPLLLPYESEKVLVWYRDNFNFNFYGLKIEAQKDYEHFGFKTYGVYDFFQPVMVTGMDKGGTIIQMPVSGINNQNDDFEPENISNCIPVFYLKYIDDVGDYSDAKETIGLVVDIVLTFTGISTLTKLKYLRGLSKLKNIESVAASSTTRIVYLEAFSEAVAAIEVVAGTSSTILSYIKNSCTDPAFCEALDRFLFALEIASFSGDQLAKRMLRNRAQDVLEVIPAEGWPDQLTTFPETNPKNVIEKLANLTERINQFRADLEELGLDNIIERFDELGQLNKKKFYFQFSEKPDLLEKLNAAYPDNSSRCLMDEWIEITSTKLQKYKKDLTFLENYKLVRIHPRLTTHVHTGHAGVTASGKAWVNGNHNPFTLDDNTKWRFVSPGDVIEKNGYMQGFVERNMSDFNWQGSSPPAPPLSWKKKGDETTFWKKMADDEATHIQKVNEEMAFALTNKKFKRDEIKRDGSIRKIYHGHASDGQLIEIVIDGQTNDVISIYPNLVD